MITITVSPMRKYPGKFEARCDGRLLCGSHQPFVDAARVLVAEGRDPNELLVMRHEGSAIDALTARLGAAARLTVWEWKGPPTFGQWMPRNYEMERPPVSFSEGAATP
jgi:hypothetical protein